jgi:hypothetical protein
MNPTLCSQKRQPVTSWLRRSIPLALLTSALAVKAGTENCPDCKYVSSIYGGVLAATRCDLDSEARMCVEPGTADFECFINTESTVFNGTLYIKDFATGEWFNAGPCQETLYECYTNDTTCWRS